MINVEQSVSLNFVNKFFDFHVIYFATGKSGNFKKWMWRDEEERGNLHGVLSERNGTEAAPCSPALQTSAAGNWKS